MASGINFLTAKLVIISIIIAATNADVLSDFKKNMVSASKDTGDPYADFDASFENLMISPNTPVYTIRSDKTKYFVREKEFNVFRATKTYNYYNNPENDRSNTYVINILLILDYFEGDSQINETRYTNKILLDLDYAAKKLGELSNPKIKLHVSAVAKLKDKEFLNLPTSTFFRKKCYDMDSTHKKVGEWLYNSVPFYDADYNKYIFATNERLCPPVTRLLSDPSYYVPENMNCISTGETAVRRGGLFYFGSTNSKVWTTQMIAETFGVNFYSNFVCFIQYVLDKKIPNLSSKESNLSQECFEHYAAKFEKIIGNARYECYKMPPANDVGESNESGYTNLILGPNTYVYNIEYPHDNYVKIESDLNKFQATPAYNDYRNSKIDLNNTYVINILLIYDWSLNEINANRADLLDSILKKLNIAAAYLNNLQYMKIKLRISGIAIAQHPDIFDLPGTQKTSSWGQPCYHLNASLHYLKDWLLTNNGQFEHPSFDFFLFVTSRASCGDKIEPESLTEPDIGPILTYDCSATRTLVKSSGGIVQYDPFFLKHVTQILADRFNVRGRCSWSNGWHPIQVWKRLPCVTWSSPRKWADCENLETWYIRSKPEYSCYKMPAFNPDSVNTDVDDDYQ